MLPGKKYSPEDIGQLAVRRAWFIIIPLMIGTAAAVAVGERLPKQYKSETLIMVVPQRIPESYVKSNGMSNIVERLATLEDQLLSRTRLERLILDLNLYPRQRRTAPMEDVVQRMRSDITIKTDVAKEAKDSSSFRIFYVSDSAKTAQKTTERLASLFIEENLRDRENVAEDTSQFLDSQLQDARQRLVEQEKKLEEYRRRFSGQLPSQASANLQAIQNAQLQVQSLREATDRARERRLLVERQLADLQSPDPVPVAAVPSVRPDGVPVDSTPAQQLENAKTRLQLLETHYKPDHPDVLLLKRTIRDLEGKQQGERKERAAAASEAAGKTPPPVVDKDSTPAELLRQKKIRDLKAQMDDLDRELSDKQRQEQNLSRVVADYQSKLDAVPSRESDLVELTRDYLTLQTTYQSLLARREESKLAANLERRNIGEQFKVLDPARVPETPFSPNMAMITLGGAGGGLALGLLFAAFLEYRDSSFKREDDVVRLCGVPVMALVPLMASPEDVRSTRRRKVIINTTGVFVVVAAAAVIVLSLRF
jgi:polysaccharide chain length determinant protein (PEP-CTERM system associated)